MDKQPMIMQKLGGKYQLVIERPEDLAHINILDEAHWVATDAPCESFICDPAFLKYMDADANGLIRSEEIKTAVQWLFRMLSDYRNVGSHDSILVLDTIDTSQPEGEALHASASHILSCLGAENATEISIDQVRNRQQIMAAGDSNGDGIIPVDSITDENTGTFAKTIIDTVGGTPDSNGKMGVTSESLDKFLADAKAYLEWEQQGAIPEGETTTPIMIRGEKTPATYNALANIEDKLDEYFNFCRFLKIDERIKTKFPLDEAQLTNLDITDKAAVVSSIETALIAPPNPDEILVLDEHINPAYEERIKTFCQELLEPVKRGRIASISRSEWDALKKEFTEYSTWLNSRRGATVEKIGDEKLNEYLTGDLPDKIRELIENDKKVANEIQQVDNIEKLILYQRWLKDMANNYISFSNVYNPETKSLIQLGKLIMDGRHFNFTMKITDRAKHKKIAEKSNIFIMYLELSRQDGDKIEKMEAATAVTSGTMGSLYVDKKGVFFTTDGREWETKILDFIKQPVSLNEAIRMPFIKLGEFIKKQTEKFTASRYKDLEDGVGKSMTNAEKSLASKKPAAPPAGPSWGGLSFLMLGGGISLAALGSAFAYITKTLKSVSLLNVAFVIICILMVVASPIIIVAYIKLRRRNLGMFLEACGWSINAPMRVTRKVGLLFTHTPALPKEAERRCIDLSKPFLKRVDIQKNHWAVWIISILVVIAIGLGIGALFRSKLNVDKKVESFFAVSEQPEKQPVKSKKILSPPLKIKK